MMVLIRGTFREISAKFLWAKLSGIVKIGDVMEKIVCEIKKIRCSPHFTAYVFFFPIFLAVF